MRWPATSNVGDTRWVVYETFINVINVIFVQTSVLFQVPKSKMTQNLRSTRTKKGATEKGHMSDSDADPDPEMDI